MPTTIHDAHQPWLEYALDCMIMNQVLTFTEKHSFERYVGTSKSLCVLDIYDYS